ncbi:MAG: arylsulfatase [Phocaeicola sp.]
MNTKRILLGSAILPLASIGLSAAQAHEKPNVIFILVDDLGIGDLGCYGQRIIKTPHIDQMAANGVLFTNHYSGSTVSAPSRCSLLTGKHTGHTFIRGNIGYRHTDGFPYDLPLKDEEFTVGELFQANGYKTLCFGKWGLGGPDSEGHPNKQGFDHFYGYLGQANAHSYYPQQIFENNTPVVLNRAVYTHDLIAGKALDFLKSESKDPYFVYLSITLPHADLVVPEEDRAGYKDKFPEINYPGPYRAQEQPRATYAAMVTRIDQTVGAVIEALKQSGQYENTLILFASDNGIHQEGGIDPYFFDSNGPFRGGKRDLYEGGIRTPFIASFPKYVKEGRVSYHAGAFWDFFPTVCDLIGAKQPQGLDGISYLPQITGAGKQKEHDTFYFEFHEQGGKQALIQGDWKLIRLGVNTDKPRLELYNLAKDVAEVANVAAQYPKKVDELVKLMDKERSSNENWEFTKK